MDDNLFTKAIFVFIKLVASYVFFILDGINFYQGHIFAFSKRLLWLVSNLQLRLVKPLHAHHGHVPGDDDDDGDDGDGDDNDVDDDDDNDVVDDDGDLGHVKYFSTNQNHASCF